MVTLELTMREAAQLERLLATTNEADRQKAVRNESIRIQLSDLLEANGWKLGQDWKGPQ